MKTVSVIMPTYNSAQFLQQCLDSFKRQTFQNWELVCVDRGSTDGTLDILSRNAREWDKIRVLDGGDERTSQINRGVRNTQSEFIYYTASDFDVDPGLLEDAVRVAREAPADAVWFNCISYGDGFWARVRNLERSTYFGSVQFEGARFFSRSLYELSGGYDDKVPVFEEYDLQHRMMAAGGKFARVTTSVERHLGEPRTLGEIWRKHYYYGKQFRKYYDKQGPSTLKYGNPVRMPLLRGWRQFIAHPTLAFGFLIMWSTKYIAGGLGFASTFLKGSR